MVMTEKIPVAGPWARDVLSVRGPDALRFLQGQLSADVESLEVGQSATALLLEPTGKLGWLLRIWRTDENIVFMDTDGGQGGAVAERLGRFLLRTDASVERHEWECIAVRGPGSHAVDVSDTSAVLVGVGLWPSVEGIDLLGPSVSAPPRTEPVPAEALEFLRVASGWPAHGSEFTDGVIPAELGAWVIDSAVSFTKGCYVGQELTARMDSRGAGAPRNLVVLEPARPAAPGARILSGGEVVGEVTSAATDPVSGSNAAMGFVKRSAGDVESLTIAAPTS